MLPANIVFLPNFFGQMQALRENHASNSAVKLQKVVGGCLVVQFQQQLATAASRGGEEDFHGVVDVAILAKKRQLVPKLGRQTKFPEFLGVAGDWHVGVALFLQESKDHVVSSLQPASGEGDAVAMAIAIRPGSGKVLSDAERRIAVAFFRGLSRRRPRQSCGCRYRFVLGQEYRPPSQLGYGLLSHRFKFETKIKQNI